MFKKYIFHFIIVLYLYQIPSYAQEEMYIEEVEHQKRHELIEEYQSILKINSIQFPKRAEILFRLAEQEFKAGRYYYFTEMEIFQEKYD